MARHATSSRAETSLHHFMTESHEHMDTLFSRLLDVLEANAR